MPAPGVTLTYPHEWDIDPLKRPFLADEKAEAANAGDTSM
jgi:hypothetical protein